jgi:hypothetical protein
MAEYLIALLDSLPSLPYPRDIPPGGKTADCLPYLEEITGGKNVAISHSEMSRRVDNKKRTRLAVLCGLSEYH